MKTTVDIPEETLNDSMKYSGATTKRDAILAAMDDYNHRQRVEALFESVKNGPPLEFLSNDEIEAGEIEENADMAKLWNQSSK